MAGDVHLRERLAVLREARDEQRAIRGATPEGRALHVYGDRVRILDQGPAMDTDRTMRAEMPDVAALGRMGLSAAEMMGATAFRLRLSPEYREAKADRPRQGEAWNFRPGACHGAGGRESRLRCRRGTGGGPDQCVLGG